MLPEQLPEIKEWLQPLGFTRISESLVLFLACLECQIEQGGAAKLPVLKAKECAPYGTVTTWVIKGVERGLLNQERGEKSGICGPPANLVRFSVDVPSEVSVVLNGFRHCGPAAELIPPSLTDNTSA